MRLLLLLFSIIGLGCTDFFYSKSGEKNRLKVVKSFRSVPFKNLDPPRQYDNASADIIINIYDTLFEYHYLDRPYQLRKLLLKEVSKQKATRSTYLFELKQGIQFHPDPVFSDPESQELTSDDVIYSIKRFSDARINPYSFFMLSGRIVGIDEFRTKSQKLDRNQYQYDGLEIKGLKKIDRYRFSIEFVEDSPLNFYPFAFSGLSIVSKDVALKYGLDLSKKHIGTGPFFLKSLSQNQIVLGKNDHYFDRFPEVADAIQNGETIEKKANSGRKLPFVDEVHLPLVKDPTQVEKKFKLGEIQIMPLSREKFKEMAYKGDDGSFHIQNQYRDEFRIYSSIQAGVNLIKFNMEDELLGSNRKLRKAIAYAIDTLSTLELLANGRGIPLASIVPKGIAGNIDDVSGVTWYQHDLGKAARFLAEAGYPRGKGLPELVLEMSRVTKNDQAVFEFMKNEFAKLGIKLKANFQPFSEYLQKLTGGRFQMAFFGWTADYPDAENLYSLLYSKNRPPGPNAGAYANQKFDTIYEQIRGMRNGPERYALFKEMNQIIYEDIPVILQDAPISVGVISRRIQNFVPSGLEGIRYKYLDIK